MYYYIVDPGKINQQQFERVQNLLYSSLSEFRVAGEVVRVTGLRTINQLVQNAFAHEAKTIVAVGSEETLHEVINAVGTKEMVIGFIPLVNSELADVFGIKDIPQAAKTIAFRRIEELDLGVVNDYYFLSKIKFSLNELKGVQSLFNLSTTEIKFTADENYQATQDIVAGVIVNCRKNLTQTKIGDPRDGLLDVLLLPQVSRWEAIAKNRPIFSGLYENLPQSSILQVKKIQITNPEALRLQVGDKVIAKTPATISIAPKMLRMIVGRDRNL